MDETVMARTIAIRDNKGLSLVKEAALFVMAGLVWGLCCQ
jgi:hypothetical protein